MTVDPYRNPLAYVQWRIAQGLPNRLLRDLATSTTSPTGLVDATTGEPFTPPPEYAHLEPDDYLRMIGQ